MPVKPYHDDNLPPKWMVSTDRISLAIATIVDLAVVVLVFAYR